jgi:hypothetical protein
MAALEAEVVARTPAAVRKRAQALDERAMAGEGTPGESYESMRFVWPSYFADPENVPEMPTIELSIEAYSGIIGEITARAFLDAVPGAGHFVWFEAPGCVHAALKRLTDDIANT